MPQLLPLDLKKAIDLIEADPTRAWTVDELAAACGVARRTLQKHFRRFVGQAPLDHLRDVRLERARQELLRAPRNVSVTEIARRCGFSHLGRFATWFRERYGESPSATLRRRQYHFAGNASSVPVLTMAVDRPAVSVLPFELIGPEARHAAGMAEEIATALWRLHWIRVAARGNAQYHLRGKVRDNGRGRLRVTVILVDAPTGRILWADRWDGEGNDAFGFEERVSVGIARAIQPSLRDAEIDRAWRKDSTRLNAWELTMRALPRVLSVEGAGEKVTLEQLEQAMELAPQDALPVSLAAWCHGLRAGHRLTLRPDEEKAKARALAARAALLGTGDALAETLLAAGYTLAHDLAAAAIHVDRALTLDGGSAWAWGRSGWINAYRGEAAEAIERFQIARVLAPSDPLSFLCSIGIAAAHFETSHYDEAIRWFTRGIAEHPTAVWAKRFLAPAYALSGRKKEAERTLTECIHADPDLTIAQVRSGLPFCRSFFDRVAEGLESAGMRHKA